MDARPRMLPFLRGDHQDDDVKADEFVVTNSGGGGAKGDGSAALLKKGKAAP